MTEKDMGRGASSGTCVLDRMKNLPCLQPRKVAVERQEEANARKRWGGRGIHPDFCINHQREENGEWQ